MKRRAHDPGVAGRGVDRGVHDRLDGAAPRAGASGRSVPEATSTALRSAWVVVGSSTTAADLVDVDDDEVLRRGEGEPGTGGLDHEPSVVEELGRVALGRMARSRAEFAEQRGQGDQRRRDEGQVPRWCGS